MKVALIVPGGVGRGGTDRVIPRLLWLIERLARDVELHVFAMRQEPRPSTYPLLGATVHNIGARPRRLRAIAAIVAEHRRGRFDVLHAAWAAPQGVVTAMVGRLTGVPVVLSVTGGDLTALPDIGYGTCLTQRGRMWLRIAMTGAARVTVPSHAMNALAATRGYEAITVSPGVALDRWPARAPRTRDPNKPARLLHAASLNRVKDQRTLLRAMAELVGAGVRFHLDIVGEDTLSGEIQALAAALGLNEHVSFHGSMRHDALRGFFERADLLVMSSRHEADPIVTLEAAVVGVPTVGTAVGHIADWNGTASCAVPVGNAQLLAAAVQELLADEPRRLRLAHAAQQRAVANDADWHAEQTQKIYRAITPKKAWPGTSASGARSSSARAHTPV